MGQQPGLSLSLCSLAGARRAAAGGGAAALGLAGGAQAGRAVRVPPAHGPGGDPARLGAPARSLLQGAAAAHVQRADPRGFPPGRSLLGGHHLLLSGRDSVLGTERCTRTGCRSAASQGLGLAAGRGGRSNSSPRFGMASGMVSNSFQREHISLSLR